VTNQATQAPVWPSVLRIYPRRRSAKGGGRFPKRTFGTLTSLFLTEKALRSGVSYAFAGADPRGA
jgi:hypothetical protein